VKWPAGLNAWLTMVLGGLVCIPGTVFVAVSEPGTDTWVRVGSKKIDADIVGVLLLVIGLSLIVGSLVAIRRRETR
jgi:hypothetical protein